MRFEIFYSRENFRFYYRLRAANGSILLTGGPYDTRGQCKRAIAAVVDHAGDDARYQARVTRDGRHYFTVSNPQGEELARSRFYASSASATQAAERVKNEASVAEVVDASQLPLATPAPDVVLDVDQTDIPPDVLQEYLHSVEKVLEHVTFRDDTEAGSAFIRFADRVREGARGGAPTDDEGFDCAGSIGTFGTYGCAGGTAGTIGTAGSFGCGDPDEISLCWGNDEEDQQDGGSG